VSTALSPEEIGAALAEGAADDGWVAARPPGRISGPAREWWPGTLAVLYAADEDAAVTWVTDPDGCDLQVTKPGKPAIRFAARQPSPQPPNGEKTSAMSITVTTTYVIARDPVDPRGLFDAAREVVGNPTKWTLHDGPDFGDVHMYQTSGGQGADAVVSVHFPAAGGRYPREDPSTAGPDGYAHVGFTTGFFDSQDEAWHHHADLVRALGRWLDARQVRWCWVFENDEWIFGHVPDSRPGTVAPETGEVPNEAPDPGRTARTAADPAPADVWRPLITATREFDPENDAVLLAWMTGEAGGMAGYAEGVAAAYETATTVTGLDPAALATLHDYADAAAAAAEAMATARQRFTSHYSEVRTFTASGGVLPFNGRWMTGEGS
jgi:hypothetical protein